MHETCVRCGLFHPTTAPCISLTLPSSGTDDRLRAGTVLAGRYHVTRVLHRGGMSTIYLAEDEKLNGREVALKELRLPADASSDDLSEAEAWFARESALLSVLRHPLIPLFYSVFREDEHSYIVQEYVPGENLEDLVKRQGPVEPEAAIAWGMALCQLLDYLHKLPEPVIFRDLKPANVLLRTMWSAPERRLAVVDFGIARPYLRDTVGTVIGTPGYAPPEQYQGLATPQSDVYALGATLHRLVTAYDPEQGTPFTFPPAESLNPSVPRGLSAVIARATSLNPSERYASADEMKQALSELAPVTQHVFARRRNHSSLFDSTWMAVAAALVGISLLSRMLAFFAAQPDFGGNSVNSGPGFMDPAAGYSIDTMIYQHLNSATSGTFYDGSGSLTITGGTQTQVTGGSSTSCDSGQTFTVNVQGTGCSADTSAWRPRTNVNVPTSIQVHMVPGTGSMHVQIRSYSAPQQNSR